MFSKIKVKNEGQLHNMPSLYNSKLVIDFRREWAKKVYCILGDLLDGTGTLLTSERMAEKVLDIHYLDYFRILQNIKRLSWNIEKQSLTIGPYIPNLIFELGLERKGCQRTYNRLMAYDSNKGEKGERKVGINSQ